MLCNVKKETYAGDLNYIECSMVLEVEPRAFEYNKNKANNLNITCLYMLVEITPCKMKSKVASSHPLNNVKTEYNNYQKLRKDVCYS